MTDLLTTLPLFDTRPFSNLLPSLEKHQITITDLLTSDSGDIAKRAQLPLRQLRSLTDAVLVALHVNLGLSNSTDATNHEHSFNEQFLWTPGPDLVTRWQTVSLLDERLDVALDGGLPTGFLSEITGESGAGKTQFLLTLLLAVQLAPPIGLSRSALYISTEAPLPTSRLSQILSTHPVLSTLPYGDKPSLSKILTLQTPDLETQDHILRYQLPVAVRRHNVGLIVIDSITANFRAEFEYTGNGNGSDAGRTGPAAMAKRSAQLIEIGALLRDLARTENVAVVVANQVADRFPTLRPPATATGRGILTQPDRENAWLDRSVSEQSPSLAIPSASEPPRYTILTSKQRANHTPLTLDHQQRWFTGWGASQSMKSSSFSHSNLNLKTPSLGLVWTNQLACRVALIKTPRLHRVVEGEEVGRWRRHMKVVFAPWAKGEDGSEGIEFIVGSGGIKAIEAPIAGAILCKN